MQSIPFSAIVISCNEARRLKDCLDSLSFCEQIIVADMQSTDNSVAIAIAGGAEVHSIERVPVVEMVREQVFARARHPWIVHIDPDEVFPRERIQEVLQVITSEDVAMVRLPWRFHFMGKPLRGTIWGGENSKPCVYHRERIALSHNVHVSPKPAGGFQEVRLSGREHGCLSHFWVDSYAQMFEKHMRYIRREGLTKCAAGERFTWRYCFQRTIRAFKESFFVCKGWRDGVTGLLLSLFYAWYVAMCHRELLRCQAECNARTNDQQERV